MNIDFSQFSNKERYKFFISFIVPRPIALITSVSYNESGKEVVNAAPFSYFSGISTTPPLFMVSITKKKDSEKDTFRNIVNQKEFVVNLVNESMIKAVSISGALFPEDISEMEYNGLHVESSTNIKTPGIKESPARMEMKVIKIIDDIVEDQKFHMVIGEAVGVKINEKYYDDESMQFKYRDMPLVGRLGNDDYSIYKKVITEPIPDIKNI